MKRPLINGEWIHDPGDDLSFDYPKPLAAVVEALVAIHATGGGRQPGIDPRPPGDHRTELGSGVHRARLYHR